MTEEDGRMYGYHVTTPKKVERYRCTGAILEPVRFWTCLESALDWGRRTGRSVCLRIDVDRGRAWPLPDHRPRGHAWWTDRHVRRWEEVR